MCTPVFSLGLFVVDHQYYCLHQVQISILHHQALLYLITMKPHDIILPNLQTTLFKQSMNSTLMFIYYLKAWVAPPNM